VASCSRDAITKHGAMDYLVVKGRKTQREILSGKAVKLLRGAKASEVVDEAGFLVRVTQV
jgi:hypothetical protein